jgi:hypothetical protein
MRNGGSRKGTATANADSQRSGGATDRSRRKKGASLRNCACGRQKENKGPKERQLITAVGEIHFKRRYWKCCCGEAGAYAVDAFLGVEGEHASKIVQKHCCRFAAKESFAETSTDLFETLGVKLCPETIRTLVHRHGKRMAQFQAQDTASEEQFRQAAGAVEFTIDAGKVNTREEGWKDLKIGVIAKREAGEPLTPDTPQAWKKQRLPTATIVLAFAMIAPVKEFRASWRARLKRLGVSCMASVHVLGDGASWIWKAAQRVLTGCMQTLDFWHACQRIHKCAERIHGKETKETKAAYEHGRGLLLRQGWAGVCQWVGELLAVEDEKECERRRRATDQLIGYFAKHTQRLNYAERLRRGQAIGSGQVEGKAKTIGLRLKARGARWKRQNVRGMASLVSTRPSPQWGAYWDAYMAA